jgi:hypothetical protein
MDFVMQFLDAAQGEIPVIRNLQLIEIRLLTISQLIPEKEHVFFGGLKGCSVELVFICKTFSSTCAHENQSLLTAGNETAPKTGGATCPQLRKSPCFFFFLKNKNYYNLIKIKILLFYFYFFSFT